MTGCLILVQVKISVQVVLRTYD